VRRIPRSKRSATGAFWSFKNGCLVPFESSLERDLFNNLEFEDYVSGYEAQPVRFAYRSATGRRTSGVFDAALEHDGERFAFVDVKFRREIVTKWKTLKARLAAGRDYASEKQLQYFIRTDKHLRTKYTRNARFLNRYLRFEPDLDHGTLILNSLASSALTAHDLLESCSSDRAVQAEIVSTLWHYVATKKISCDWTQPITLETTLWLP